MNEDKLPEELIDEEIPAFQVEEEEGGGVEEETQQDSTGKDVQIEGRTEEDIKETGQMMEVFLIKKLKSEGMPEKLVPVVCTFLRYLAMGYNFDSAAIASGLSASQATIMFTVFPELQVYLDKLTERIADITLLDLAALAKDPNEAIETAKTSNGSLLDVKLRVQLARLKLDAVTSLNRAIHNKQMRKINALSKGLGEMGGLGVVSAVNVGNKND